MTRAREPVFNIPAVILAILAGLSALHALRMTLPDETGFYLLSELAFVPARLTNLFDPAGVRVAIAAVAAQGPDGPDSGLLELMGDTSAKLWTMVTYSGLHADWTHLALNSLWLLAFGSPVARRFGTVRFAGLFVATAIGGALAHVLAHPLGLAPVIGASASVSGAMGAALRFAFQQGGPRSPPLPVARVFTDPRTLPFLAVWLVVNIATGLAAVPLGLSDSNIAWEAHVGGLVAGLLLFPLFDPRPPLAPLGEAAHSSPPDGAA